MRAHSISTGDSYLEGMKRLVAISKKNGRIISASASGGKTASKRPARHICLVCGYMWNINPEKTDGPRRCPSCSSILWNNTDLKKHRCKQCSYVWMSKLENPVMCSRCKSKSWNRDTERYVCCDCGHGSRSSRRPRVCSDCLSNNMVPEFTRYKCGKCGYDGKVSGYRASICPVCGTPLSGTLRTVSKDPGNAQVPDQASMDTLRSGLGDTEKIVALGGRTGAMNAEVLVRFSNGEGPVSIAMAVDISLSKVMEILSPLYGEACK